MDLNTAREKLKRLRDKFNENSIKIEDIKDGFSVGGIRYFVGVKNRRVHE